MLSVIAAGCYYNIYLGNSSYPISAKANGQATGIHSKKMPSKYYFPPESAVILLKTFSGKLIGPVPILQRVNDDRSNFLLLLQSPPRAS